MATKPAPTELELSPDLYHMSAIELKVIRLQHHTEPLLISSGAPFKSNT